MINLIETPQRADIKSEYKVENNKLIMTIGEVTETLDATKLNENLDEITIEKLPINPIVKVEKRGEEVDVTVIRFYGADEKHLFENIWIKMRSK